MKKMVYTIILLSVLFLVAGCHERAVQQETIDNTPNEGVISDWKNIELTDVLTNEKFKVSDFTGKPILVESFAVWCPKCLQQQQEIRKLKTLEGDSIVHISLDTDPNEDESLVKKHATNNLFDWYFAVSPSDLTKILIKEFGVSVVYAPGAPVILVCEDQSTRLLNRGVKPADELKSEVEKGC